jgi:hypothetical protein
MLITDCEFLFHAELDINHKALDWQQDVAAAKNIVMSRLPEFKGKNVKLLIALIEEPVSG